ncbi:MAG: flippase-like domain-containing protein [Actinobacteria bacterium]|nr:flippase-like domain-containing protein [Thermoleophilia bacterium]MCB9011297.1 flippase-like domain-containing protein [Actinomycetota bacterium]
MIGNPVGPASEVWRSLSAVHLVPLAVGLVLHVLKVAAEARSWHGVLTSSDSRPRPVPFRPVLGAFVSSIGASTFLPGKLADVARVGMLHRRLPSLSIATLSGTVVLETIVESVFGVALIGWWVLSGGGTSRLGVGNPLTSPVGLVIAGVVVALATVLVVRGRGDADSVVARFAAGFRAVRSPMGFLRGVVAWKVAGWTLRSASIAAFLMAFGLSAAPATVAAVIAAQSTAALLPLLPGNAGTQQAAIGFALVGVATATEAVAFGVGMQAATIVADLAIGAAALPLVATGAGPVRRLTAMRTGLAGFANGSGPRTGPAPSIEGAQQ